MRTTLDIADPVLRELKKLQKSTGKSLGQLVSELLVQGLAAQTSGSAKPAFRWVSKPMGALVDIDDKDALNRALDGEP